MIEKSTAVNETSRPVTQYSDQPWLRLSSRIIWVDVAQTILSITPLLVALFVFQLEENLWPLIAIAFFGVLGAIQDAVRWIFTHYRITDNYVELRTGIVTRSYRSVKRDRIRSVDIEAKLRHRLAGLRVINIGAGQQAASKESAFEIDAVLKGSAEDLRHLLLRRPAATKGDGFGVTSTSIDDEGEVYSNLKPWWIIYNMFSIWAYAMAGGLLWGGYWILSSFGVDVESWIAVIIESQSVLPFGWFLVAVVVAVGVFGAIGMGVNFLSEYWKFELARVPGDKNTSLRTKQGLFTTKEINRDDSRLRGVNIDEPVFWRWMRAADTTVITTGLNAWSMSQPTSVLPLVPLKTAREVAGKILGGSLNPFNASLKVHPAAALRRRLTWAAAVAAVLTAVFVWLAVIDMIPVAVAAVASIATWSISLIAAIIAYRSLGHAIVGEYLVLRSGLLNRSTSVLQRKAVGTVIIRQSPLQWRLNLKTVSVTTSAGWMEYEAIDLGVYEAIDFADKAAPGLIEPFLVR